MSIRSLDSQVGCGSYAEVLLKYTILTIWFNLTYEKFYKKVNMDYEAVKLKKKPALHQP